MKNLYQTWTIGGSGYAVLQNELIVENRRFNKPDKESENLICTYSIAEPGEALICYIIDNVLSIIVDGVSMDPVDTYNFEAGEHTVEFVLIDKTLMASMMFYYVTNLISVKIPNSVQTIESLVFDSCYSLKSIVIPNSVTSIEDSIFLSCELLTSIKVSKNNPVYDSRDNCNAIIETATNTLFLGIGNTVIPKSVTSIGKGAFGYCNSLTSITIPDSITTIGDRAFNNCRLLKSIHIGKGVCNISSNAFSGCDNVTTITTDINDYYYAENNILVSKSDYSMVFVPRNLEPIIIPENIKKVDYLGYRNTKTVILNDQLERIEYQAFENCSKLESIVIPDSVTYLGNRAFSGCNSLKSVTIGTGITAIGEKTFERCNSLASITIPDSVTSIGNEAFSRCALTSITIPDSVTTIGEKPFNYCYSLIELINNSSVCGNWQSTDLETVILGNNITLIDSKAFYYCTSLTSVTVGSGLLSIGEEAFYYCLNVQYYDFTACTSIPTLSNINAFNRIQDECEIRVPAALYNDWINANNWSTYSDYIVAV